MAHGGLRQGAGRPLGSKSEKTLEREALRQYIFDEVKRNQKKIVAALIRGAVKGQIQASKELLERSIGKVKDQIELEGKQPVEFIIKTYSEAPFLEKSKSDGSKLSHGSSPGLQN